MGIHVESSRLRAEDLYGLRDDGQRHELVAGQLLSEPPVQARHGRVVTRIASELEGFVRPRNLGVVFTGDTGFVLARSPDTVRAPDVAFVSRDRHELLGDEDRFLPGPPDLAVEVLSSSDRPGEVRGKIADYLTAGTRVVWLVDPFNSRVTEYRSLFAPVVLSAGDALEAEDLLPGFSVKVSELF